MLLSKTLFIVGFMLVFTCITARFNKAFETTTEAVAILLGGFVTLSLIHLYADSYPANLVACAAFSGFCGWSMGPTISGIGERFMLNKFLKAKGVGSQEEVTKHKGALARFFGAEDEKHTVFFFLDDPGNTFLQNSKQMRALREQFEHEVLAHDPYSQEWQNLIFSAVLATTGAVFAAAFIVWFTDYDYGVLGPVLLISLVALIVGEVLNALVFKSDGKRRALTYIGIVIFAVYLIYDFNVLEKRIAQGDESWSSAVRIAVDVYLDIVNLFLELLEALADSD